MVHVLLHGVKEDDDVMVYISTNLGQLSDQAHVEWAFEKQLEQS